MRNNMQVMFPLQASAGAGALVYKDTVSSASDLPSSSEAKVGWLYIADTAFLLNGEQIEIGDELYWNGTTWNIVQGNITVEPYWEVLSFRIRPSGNDMIMVSGLYKNNSLYNGYVTLRVVDSQKWTWHNQSQSQCVDGSAVIYFDNTTLTYMSDPDVTDLVFFLIVDDKIIYSQGYGRNASGIVSGEKGYANGDQVKTYVDNNGFNPSSMPLVTDTVTLTYPQGQIASGDTGLVTGGQVYDYVGNIETLLASI